MLPKYGMLPIGTSIPPFTLLMYGQDMRGAA
jgi:hypothetical protein